MERPHISDYIHQFLSSHQDICITETVREEIKNELMHYVALNLFIVLRYDHNFVAVFRDKRPRITF